MMALNNIWQCVSGVMCVLCLEDCFPSKVCVEGELVVVRVGHDARLLVLADALLEEVCLTWKKKD